MPAATVTNVGTDTRPVLHAQSTTEIDAAMVTVRRLKPPTALLVLSAAGRRDGYRRRPELVVPDGTVLHVRCDTGLPFLVAEAGRIVFHPQSRWGNSITVAGPAAQVHVHVLDPEIEAYKVTVDVRSLDHVPNVTVNAHAAALTARLTGYVSGHGRVVFETVETAGDGTPLTWV
jgi:hypothetical protein